MNSLPTIQEANLEQYWNVIRELDPQLYLIKIALHETNVNPMIIPRIIRTLGNLDSGTGYGTIRIFMQKRIVTQVKAEESDSLNLKASMDDV